MRTACAFAVVLAVIAGAPATALAQDAARGESVEVSINKTNVSTRIGDSFDFTTRISNTGARPLPWLVAHLNVVGLDTDTYVDPEDWSEERTKGVPALGPGESTDVSWDVTAVTGGDAAIYVTALPADSPATAREAIAVSPAMDVRVSSAKDFNTDGVLPLALGVPALLGVATLAVRRRRRQ